MAEDVLARCTQAGVLLPRGPSRTAGLHLVGAAGAGQRTPLSAPTIESQDDLVVSYDLLLPDAVDDVLSGFFYNPLETAPRVAPDRSRNTICARQPRHARRGFGRESTRPSALAPMPSGDLHGKC